MLKQYEMRVSSPSIARCVINVSANDAIEAYDRALTMVPVRQTPKWRLTEGGASMHIIGDTKEYAIDHFKRNQFCVEYFKEVN